MQVNSLVIPLRSLVVCFSALLFLDSAFAKSFPYTGTWVKRGGSTLLVIDPGKFADFQFELSGGPPSFNQGFLQGKLSIIGGKATFVHPEMPECKIVFTFHAHSVVVEQVNLGDCGFGSGVYALGTYKLQNRKPASFYRCWPQLNQDCDEN
jgi:hypothetical protein